MSPDILLIATYANCPRTWKMAKSLTKAGFKTHLIEWDRDSRLKTFEIVNDISVHRFCFKSPHGVKLIYLLPMWWSFIVGICFTHRFSVVQPQNLDNLLPVWFVSRIKKFKIVYDIADFYSDSYVPVKATFLNA